MITAAVIPTSAKIISPSGCGRAWAVFQNNSMAGIWIKFDPSSTTLTSTNGILIPTNGTPFKLDKSNDGPSPFQNNIYAIATGGNPTLIYHDSV